MLPRNDPYENDNKYHKATKIYSTNDKLTLFPLILRAIAIGVILGNIFYFLYYIFDVPPLIHTNNDNLNNNALEMVSRNIDYQHKYINNTITLENRFLRRPPSKNCSLPPGYPASPPGWKRLIRICSKLVRFSISCPDDQACIECLPPWGGKEWLIESTTRFIKREYETRIRRRKELQDIITQNLRLMHDESSITLMTLNSGYIYLFLNWLCGLHQLGIADDIRLTTIIIATDEKTEILAHRSGFQVVRGDWLKEEIDIKAAPRFAEGAHKWAVSLQIVYTFDLIMMGYNVLQQDVDVVWLRDVRKYFENTYNDIEMACDGRLDDIGPGNSGFIHVRSNCKTKVYMETLIYYIGLVIAGRSDQRHWNMFLTSYDFRQLLFEMLPPDMFVGGDQWGNGKKKGDKLSDHIWFLHASWTGSHAEKITKFKALDAWFFNEKCQFYSNDITIPEHKDPPYYMLQENRDWTWPDPKGKIWWKTKNQKLFYEK